MDKVNVGAVNATLGFGAALGAIGLASDVEAVVISLTPTGSAPYTSVTSAGGINVFNFVGGGFALSVGIWNDPLGQTVSTIGGGIDGILALNSNDLVTASAPFLTISEPVESGTGVQNFGFQTTGGNLGFFEVSFGGNSGTPTTILSAAIETDPGVSIEVGATAIPLPGALPLLGSAALLAAGAGALRRRRKQAKAA